MLHGPVHIQPQQDELCPHITTSEKYGQSHGVSEDDKSFTYFCQELCPVSVHGHAAQPNSATPLEHCLTLHLLQAVHPVLPHLLCLCKPQQEHQHQVFQLQQLNCMQACIMHKHHSADKVTGPGHYLTMHQQKWQAELLCHTIRAVSMHVFKRVLLSPGI